MFLPSLTGVGCGQPPLISQTLAELAPLTTTTAHMFRRARSLRARERETSRTGTGLRRAQAKSDCAEKFKLPPPCGSFGQSRVERWAGNIRRVFFEFLNFFFVLSNQLVVSCPGSVDSCGAKRRRTSTSEELYSEKLEVEFLNLLPFLDDFTIVVVVYCRVWYNTSI